MNARPWRPPLVLVGAVAVAYGNAFWGAFQFDDYNVIVDNPQVHSWAAFLSAVTRGIRPLLKFTYAANWISGLGPFGFHLFNLTVHAANTLFVYSLSRRCVQSHGPAPAAAPPLTALLASLLFALHPVQTEAVTYLSGRSMSLMAFFYLGSLLAYAHGAGTARRSWLYLVSPGLFLLAVLTRETAITLPLALLLWELRGRAGQTSWSAALRRQAVHWSLLACALAFLALHPTSRRLFLFGFEGRSLPDNLLSQIHGIAYLLSRLVWVHRLNIDPDLPVFTSWTPVLAVEAALLLSFLVLGVMSLRRVPVAGIGILWFFVHLLPTNSLVPRLDVANERHLYLAAWGVFLAVASGVEAMQRVWGRGWVRAGIVSGMAVLACFTIARNQVYRSEVALWKATAAQSPGRARVLNNLGYAHQRAGRLEEAARAYREALRLDPDYRLARGNLASLFTGMVLRRATASSFRPGARPAGSGPG